SGSGPVTAYFQQIGGDPNYKVTNAVIAVTRYSGVDADAPLGVFIRANTRGLDGSCSPPGITDTDNYLLPLTTARHNSKGWCAAAIGPTSHAPGIDFVERNEVHAGSGSAAAGLAVTETLLPLMSTAAVEGTLSAATEWAIMAVEVHVMPH